MNYVTNAMGNGGMMYTKDIQVGAGHSASSTPPPGSLWPHASPFPTRAFVAPHNALRLLMC